MERQYYPQRFRYLPNGRPVGTIKVGDIFYIPADIRPFSVPERAASKEPWQVEAWIPRETARWDPVTKRYATVRCAGGHLALMRSLRNSRRRTKIADWILLACDEAGLTK